MTMNLDGQIYCCFHKKTLCRASLESLTAVLTVNRLRGAAFSERQ